MRQIRELLGPQTSQLLGRSAKSSSHFTEWETEAQGRRSGRECPSGLRREPGLLKSKSWFIS